MPGNGLRSFVRSNEFTNADAFILEGILSEKIRATLTSLAPGQIVSLDFEKSYPEIYKHAGTHSKSIWAGDVEPKSRAYVEGVLEDFPNLVLGAAVGYLLSKKLNTKISRRKLLGILSKAGIVLGSAAVFDSLLSPKNLAS
ncbi:MAG: hypothetical protein Q7K42_04250, partial [Candidatus Diapherotrites archaeon]|nr:hypothetical protein [Candidatus Diapherotrites archaeon]